MLTFPLFEESDMKDRAKFFDIGKIQDKILPNLTKPSLKEYQNCNSFNQIS